MTIQPGDVFLGNNEWLTPEQFIEMTPEQVREVYGRRDDRSTSNDKIQVLDAANQEPLPLPTTHQAKQVSVHQSNVLPLPSTA